MRQRFLHARDARQQVIDRASDEGGTVIFASTSVPGAEKGPPGLDAIFLGACERLESRLEASLLERGRDVLGPWALFCTWRAAADAKRAAVEIETARPSSRLLDLDVYDSGRQVDRASLGLPPRTCLVCSRPAVECIRIKRHEAGELNDAVRALLSVRLRGAPAGSDPRAAAARQVASRATERLATCLVTGARIELALTPKPGLVDREDNGSHPDLSFRLMSRSVDLLPQYFEELSAAAGTRAHSSGLTAQVLSECVQAGRRAERRMLDTIGSNAHRGYIFLGGLALLASLEGEDQLRDSIRRVARDLADMRGAHPEEPVSHGSLVRHRHALGGIEREALDGLPSVFDHGLPALRARRSSHDGRRGADTDDSLHYAMAVLMQAVEDTTAVYRCGAEALGRIHDDGRHLQALMDQGRAYLPWLRELNAAYRRRNLTMGGVADCLALTVALDRWSRA
jgi:holo-ACP synthase CitX